MCRWGRELQVMLGPEVAEVMPVFAGDVVPAKKPDPAIYTLAARELGIDPARCLLHAMYARVSAQAVAN